MEEDITSHFLPHVAIDERNDREKSWKKVMLDILLILDNAHWLTHMFTVEI